jgi:hypothetical protein
MEKKYLLAFLLFLVPLSAFADNERGGDAQNLGWVAIGSGLIAMVPIFATHKIKRYVTNTGGVSTVQLESSYKSVLNLHIILTSVGYVAGMAHGLFLVRHIDVISLSLAITMTAMMASGILLKYTQSRNIHLFNKLLHGQTMLVVLLAILICLHVITRF